MIVIVEESESEIIPNVHTDKYEVYYELKIFYISVFSNLYVCTFDVLL